MTEVGSAPEPFELLSLRADLSEAQQRIERATRQLELAAELEARLETVLQATSAPGIPLAPSPARQATELEATGILLEAELRAAEILNASGSPGARANGSDAPSIGSDVARAIEHHLRALADVERSLVELGTRALQLEDGESPGTFDFLGDGRPGAGPERPAGGVVPGPRPRPPHRGDAPDS
jgi:hypothetical protein